MNTLRFPRFFRATHFSFARALLLVGALSFGGTAGWAQTTGIVPSSKKMFRPAKSPGNDGQKLAELQKDIQSIEVVDGLPPELQTAFGFVFGPELHEPLIIHVHQRFPDYHKPSGFQYWLFRDVDGHFRTWKVASWIPQCSLWEPVASQESAVVFLWGFVSEPLEGGLDVLKVDASKGTIQSATAERLDIKYTSIGTSPDLSRTAYVLGGGPNGETEALTGPGPMRLPPRFLHVYNWQSGRDEKVLEFAGVNYTNDSVVGPFVWWDNTHLLWTQIPFEQTQISDAVRAEQEKVEAARIARGQRPVYVRPGKYGTAHSLYVFDAATRASTLIVPNARIPLPSPDRKWLAYHPNLGTLVVAPWPLLAPVQTFLPAPRQNRGSAFGRLRCRVERSSAVVRAKRGAGLAQQWPDLRSSRQPQSYAQRVGSGNEHRPHPRRSRPGQTRLASR